MSRLLLDPLFHQKDLFAPATVEETLQTAGDVVHLADSPTISLRARLGILLARGVILLPARSVCSRTFRLPMDDSLLLLLVLLFLGGNHTPSHLTSLPKIRPDTHFSKGGESPPPPPIRRLGCQFSFSSDDKHKPSVVLLLPDEGEGDISSVALPHRRCYLTTS